MPDPREPLGRIVRETWVAWAREQRDPKPAWLVDWEDLDDGQREVDMRIGVALADATREVEDEVRRAQAAFSALARSVSKLDGHDAAKAMMTDVSRFVVEWWGDHA